MHKRIVTCLLMLILALGPAFADTDLDYHHQQMVKRMDLLEGQLDNATAQLEGFATYNEILGIVESQQLALEISMDALMVNLPTNILIIVVTLVFAVLLSRGAFANTIVKERIIYVDHDTGLTIKEMDVRLKQRKYNANLPKGEPSAPPTPPDEANSPELSDEPPEQEVTHSMSERDHKPVAEQELSQASKQEDTPSKPRKSKKKKPKLPPTYFQEGMDLVFGKLKKGAKRISKKKGGE